MSNFIDDISTLDGEVLGEIDQPTANEPYETVKTGGSRFATPPAGKYNLQLPTEIKVGAWPAKDGRKGSIELLLDPVVISNPGGPGDGLEIRYVSVSTRRLNGNCSSATDLLQRCGYSPMPRNAAEWQDAARAIAGQIVEGVYCDWEARSPKDVDPEIVRNFLKEQRYNTTSSNARKIVLRGMRNFPKGTDGTVQSKVVFESGPNGQALTLYANLKPTLRGFGLSAEEAAAQG
jgi:hypothetical protein